MICVIFYYDIEIQMSSMVVYCDLARKAQPWENEKEKRFILLISSASLPSISTTLSMCFTTVR